VQGGKGPSADDPEGKGWTDFGAQEQAAFLSWLDDDVTGGGGKQAAGGASVGALSTLASAPRKVLSASQEKEIVSALEVQLAAGNRADLDLIRQSCARLGTMPSEMRGQIWTHLLGRNNNSNVVWASQLDLSNQKELHLDCQRASREVFQARGMDIDSEEDQKELAVLVGEMELLLTTYCKRRSVRYPSRLCDLIAPFFLLDMPNHTLFNCFYVVCSTFLPRLVCVPQVSDA
jgi:hypothetical protein